MGNSAFNKGQSGNATEVGAGVVKLATQAQIDAKQADDGGVPLVATPDKLPSPTAVSQYVAAEAISVGDIVGLSHFTPTTGVYYNNNTTDSYFTDMSSTTWYAQKFKTPTLDGDPHFNIASIRNITVYNSNNDAEYFQSRLRASLTGPDLLTSTEFGNDAGGFATAFGRLDSGVEGLSLAENTEYFHIMHHLSGTLTGLQTQYQSTFVDGPPGVSDPCVYKSTDSGATWTPIPGITMANQMSTEQAAGFGHYKVFKSSAASSSDYRFGVYGVALNDAAIGEPVVIEFGRLMEGFTGLTPDRKYYLSDTPGEVSLTAGTLRLELGRATSSTQILRTTKGGVQVNVPLGTFYPAMDGILVGNDTGTAYIQLSDRCDFDAGEIAYSRIYTNDSAGGAGGIFVRPGDRVVSEGGMTNWYFSPLFQI